MWGANVEGEKKFSFQKRKISARKAQPPQQLLLAAAAAPTTPANRSPARPLPWGVPHLPSLPVHNCNLWCLRSSSRQVSIVERRLLARERLVRSSLSCRIDVFVSFSTSRRKNQRRGGDLCFSNWKPPRFLPPRCLFQLLPSPRSRLNGVI